MATYLEVAETIARRMGGIVTVSPNKYRGKTFLIVGSRKKEYFTFPPTLDPTKDVWVPGGYVTCNIPRLHETALRPIFVASGRPGVKWADLVAETDYAQLKEREKGINEALGVDLLQTNVGAKGDYKGDSPRVCSCAQSWRSTCLCCLDSRIGVKVGEVGSAVTKAASG